MDEKSKTSILIIIPGIPFPPVNGYKLKIYNLIKILSKYYDLHLVTIDKNQLSREQKGFIESHSYTSKHFINNTFFALLRTGFSVFKAIPLQVAYFTLPSVKQYIAKETGNDKFAILNLVRVGEYLPYVEQKRIVFDVVDAMSVSYLKSRKNTNSLIHKLIYQVEAKRLLNYEKTIISNSSLTLCVNPFDAVHFSKYGETTWLPNGVKEELLTYNKFDNKYSRSIVFFGTMNYQPNVDAMIWFVNHVLSYINSPITLYIIGSNPAKQIRNLVKKKSNIVITGFIEDPYVILNSCLCSIAPMQNGGGIQNKLLETMALGKVNILTTYGAKPIRQGKNREHFLVSDNGLEMAEMIDNLYLKPEDYKHIGVNAKKLIERHYTWNNYELHLLEELKKIDDSK